MFAFLLRRYGGLLADHCQSSSACCIQVYKATLDGVSDVAVKFLKPEAADQASSIEKFVAEIDVLRACRDTHVVGFLGAWAHNVSISAAHCGAISRRILGSTFTFGV